MKYILSILSLLALVIACKPAAKPVEGSPEANIKAFEDSLMAVHDTIMPRLNETQDLSSQLRKIRADLKEDGQGKIVPPPGLDEALESLKLADQGMWDWMKNYHDGRDSVPKEQIMPYLQTQMDQIHSVKRQIEESIEKAQAFLATYQGKSENG